MKTARIASMDEFRAVKVKLFAKYGDRIIMGSAEDTKEILKDLAAAAKFAKLPVERLHTALARQYAETVYSQPKPEERARDEQGLRCIS